MLKDSLIVISTFPTFVYIYYIGQHSLSSKIHPRGDKDKPPRLFRHSDGVT